jgi:glutamine synthetase
MRTLTEAEAQAFLDAHPAVRYVDLYVVDLAGTARGKRITAEKLTAACRDGIFLPISIYASDVLGNPVESTGLGLATGDADYLCRPRADRLCVAPWDESLALVPLAMLDVDGAPVYADPLNVLAALLARLDALGVKPRLAIEMEFFLFATGSERLPPAFAHGVRSRREQHQNQVYGLAELDDFAPFLDAVRRAALEMDVPVESITAEYGPGQLEINVHHRDDAARACFDALLLKRAVTTLAADFGLAATFMAKPAETLSGNGMHVHLSLAGRDGRNVFEGEPAPNAALASAIAGLLATREDFLILCAPHANSYRRFQRYSYAPVHGNWGLNNRSVSVRIPAARGAGTRLEHRLASADANPFLLTSAILAGVHHGLSHALTPPPPASGDTYATGSVRAPSWERAIDTFATSVLAERYFGRAFVDLLTAVKRHEWELYHRSVPEQDFRWYF